MTVLLVLGALVLVALIVAGVVVALSRRSHLRSWRLGVFYDSEERYDHGGTTPSGYPSDSD